MRYRTKRVSDAQLVAYINAHLTKNGGAESVSYMVSCIRSDGQTFPTNHSAAMREFERLGFRIVQGEKRQYSWRVHMGARP